MRVKCLRTPGLEIFKTTKCELRFNGLAISQNKVAYS